MRCAVVRLFRFGARRRLQAVSVLGSIRLKGEGYAVCVCVCSDSEAGAGASPLKACSETPG